MWASGAVEKMQGRTSTRVGLMMWMAMVMRRVLLQRVMLLLLVLMLCLRPFLVLLWMMPWMLLT